MTCIYCGYQNNEKDRCPRCGRKVNHLKSDLSSHLDEEEAEKKYTPRWKKALQDRVEIYRHKEDTTQSAANSEHLVCNKPSNSLSAVSVDQKTDYVELAPYTELKDPARELNWQNTQPNATKLANTREIEKPYLPPLGRSEELQPKSIIETPFHTKKTPNTQDVLCKAVVAPVQVRFLAGMLDATILTTALGVFFGVFHGLGGTISIDPDSIRIIGIAAFLLMSFYWIIHIGYLGGTPGMICLGLQLLNFHGHRASRREKAIRALGLIFSSTAMGSGFIWALVDDEKLGWHDRISKTFTSRDRAISSKLRSGLVQSTL